MATSGLEPLVGKQGSTTQRGNGRFAHVRPTRSGDGRALGLGRLTEVAHWTARAATFTPHCSGQYRLRTPGKRRFTMSITATAAPTTRSTVWLTFSQSVAPNE